MKRIRAACLEQTIHFELKEEIEHSKAVMLAKKEAEAYKAALARKRIRYQIKEESVLPDGSIQLQIKKQYNSYPCGGYVQE